MVPRRERPPEKGGLRCGKKGGGRRETNLRREFRRGGDLYLALLTKRNQRGGGLQTLDAIPRSQPSTP